MHRTKFLFINFIRSAATYPYIFYEVFYFVYYELSLVLFFTVINYILHFIIRISIS